MLKQTDRQLGFGIVEAILIAFVLGLIGFAGWRMVQIYNQSIASPDTMMTVNDKIPKYVPTSDYAKGVKFQATITADGCAQAGLPIGDVGCSLALDTTRSIRVVHGNTLQTHPWGQRLNFSSSQSAVGKRVDVYAHQTGSLTYTLEGSADFYVKIID